MSCLNSLNFDPVIAAVILMWLAVVLVLVMVVRQHHFSGRFAFIVAVVAMLWWLTFAGLELSSDGLECQIVWSLAAWPGIALLPVAWAIFLWDYTLSLNESRKPIRLILYCSVPVAVGAIALTNDQHHLLYGPGNFLSRVGDRSVVVYDHGPIFYAIAAGLYVYIMCALGVLIYSFFKAETYLRPFIFSLCFITVLPLVGNAAYIGLGFTIFGFDPTPFLFGGSIVVFAGTLLTNRVMDTAAQGRDSLFYAMSDPVFVINSFGQLVGANSAAEALIPRHRVKAGLKVDEVDELKQLRLTIDRHNAPQEPTSITIGKRIYDPRILPIPSPIWNNNPLGWSVTLMDITERVRSAEALKEALIQAQAADKAKTEFLDAISHEMRTPLTSLKGGLELVLGGAGGEISDSSKSILEVARRGAVRLQELIESILETRNLELEQLRLNFSEIELNDFLRKALRDFNSQATTRSVEVLLRSEADAFHIQTDPTRLKQILGIILSNAIKFSPPQSQVICSFDSIGPDVLISVQDFGMGIPEDAEEIVFGRFTQADASSTRHVDGAGLGLYFAKLLSEKLGGEVSYESRLGHGSTFYIKLPRNQRISEL